jgi:long-subunit acyl-CoA synthetase (AMP-forming)
VVDLGKQVNAALGDWGDAPTFLQVRRQEGTTSTLAGEFSRQIVETANQLSAWGIQKGHLVPIFLSNSTDFINIFLSLVHIGAIPVLAKLEYRVMELSEIFQNAEPAAVITEIEHLPILKPYLRDKIVIVRHQDRLSLIQSSEPKEPAKDLPDDIASINYTYRGYGYPLGAMISHAQYLHGARVLQEGLQGAAGEKMLVILPMAHIFTMVGCILVPLLYRMTSVIVDTMHPHLLFQYIREYRIEHVTSVPEIYELLYRLHDASIGLSSLKVFVSGGSILTPDSFEKLKRAFSIDLLHGYGLTEFTPVSRNMRHEARPGTVGPICDKVECRIDAPTRGATGEILVRTPHETGCYYRRPVESAESHIDGWFRTGDSGRIDEGHLVFEKELKNTRKVNGNIVDLAEVARAIRTDADIGEVHVEWEKNSLTARIGLARRIEIEEKTKTLKSVLRNVVAGYKVPQRFSVM